MKTRTSITLNLAGALLLVIASATIAGAQTGSDTCVGLNATIGGTCAPLTNTTSANSGNTAIGTDVLLSNTTGRANAAVGTNALQNNTGGGTNVAFGHNALFGNTTGSDNTAIGSFAMQNSAIGQ